MIPPSPPANDSQSFPSVPRPCVPRPPRPRTDTPASKESAPPKPRLVSSAPPPAPRRTAAKSTKPTPPPLPEPVLLADADLIDDEDTTKAARAPQPSSEDVDFDCFTRSEPPPESRPRRKQALLAWITGLVLVAMTGLVLLVRPFASRTVQRVDTASAAVARVPATLTVAALSPSTVHGPPRQALTTTISAKKSAKHSAQKRAVATSAAKR